MSLLKRDAESNWVLRLNNLRKLVNSLLAFYGESSPYIEEVSADIKFKRYTILRNACTHYNPTKRKSERKKERQKKETA